MQIIVLFVTIISFLCRDKIRSYSELIEEFGCHNTEFRLSCGVLSESIAIFDAIFSHDESFLKPHQTSCGNPDFLPNNRTWKWYKLKIWENFFQQRVNLNGIVELSFRHAINRRCSGVNHCSFVLNKDFEAASTLGPGAVYLRYACVDDAQTIRTCNESLDVIEEGFVKTPGYPHYYIGEIVCTWSLRASPPQRVRVTFLDVSLRGFAPYEVSCLDWLTVSEDGLNLLTTCGDVVEDTFIISDGSALNVTFKSSSKNLFPKRGLLFHYKAVGCPSLQKPRDGYLINRNETFAHYRCGIGFVFPDTLTRDKTLKCFNENTWDSVALDCINETEISKEKNSTDLIIEARTAMEKSDSMKDIIVPSIVMCILFIGNGIVLYIIYRQRKKLKNTEKMELKEISNLQEA